MALLTGLDIYNCSAADFARDGPALFNAELAGVVAMIEDGTFLRDPVLFDWRLSYLYDIAARPKDSATLAAILGHAERARFPFVFLDALEGLERRGVRNPYTIHHNRRSFPLTRETARVWEDMLHGLAFALRRAVANPAAMLLRYDDDAIQVHGPVPGQDYRYIFGLLAIFWFDPLAPRIFEEYGLRFQSYMFTRNSDLTTHPRFIFTSPLGYEVTRRVAGHYAMTYASPGLFLDAFDAFRRRTKEGRRLPAEVHAMILDRVVGPSSHFRYEPRRGAG